MTIVLFDPIIDFSVDETDPHNGLVAQFELPESVFKRIQVAAKKMGVSIEDFFHHAFQEKLVRDSIIAPRTGGQPQALLQQRMNLRDLESSVEKSSALFMVLADKVDDPGLLALASDLVLKLQSDCKAVIESFNQPAASLASTPENGGVL